MRFARLSFPALPLPDLVADLRRTIQSVSARARCLISQSSVVPLPTSGRRAAASSTPLTFRTIESR